MTCTASVPFNLEHASMARSQMVEAFSVVRPTVGGTADGTRVGAP